MKDISGELDELVSWMLRENDEDGTVLPRPRCEFGDFKDPVVRSIEYGVIEMSEVARNTNVYIPLLYLAFTSSPSVGIYNIIS